MSKEQELKEILVSEKDKKQIENAFFAQTVKLFPIGVLIRGANSKKEEVDLAITNEDIADIYNTINGESPYGDEDQTNE
jgi:hypothetical protein